MSARRTLSHFAWLIAAAAGCSYEPAAMTPVVSSNTCSMSSECMDGTECMGGMCIAQKADAPLSIALQITPARMPGGEESLPTLINPMQVEAPTERSFELRRAIPLSGLVLAVPETAPDDTRPVALDAEVSFTPTANIRGIPRKVITSSVAASVTGVNYQVELLNGVEYSMAVRPKDTSLPPHYEKFVASAGEAPIFTYPRPSELYAQKIRIVDEGRTKRTFLVRALSQTMNDPISSTAVIATGAQETKQVDPTLGTLRFIGEPEPFLIEVRAQPQPTTDNKTNELQADGYCDSNTSAYPVFTARSQDLATAQGELRVTLPALLAPIRFEGSVALCETALDTSTVADSLPIALHARSVLLPDGNALPATFDVTTTATRDADSRELQFCVQVLPGEYDVVATPVSTMPCALYVADKLTVAAPKDRVTAGAMLFTLPEPAYLTGELRTMDGMPLRGASVDAMAVGGGARSRPSATDSNGKFELQVDLGTYDLVVKPAAGSGLPWQVRHSVTIGSPEPFDADIPMYLPVSLQGALRYPNPRSDDPSMADALVAAFAIVKDDDGGERAVPIGSTTADAMGKFTLLLPPSIQHGITPIK
jgi:hypothetical protein